MRWAVPRQPKAPDINVGDKRTVTKFAWWPVLVDLDDELPARVWLETYFEQQVYTSIRKDDGYGYYYKYKWVREGRWSSDPFIDEALRQLQCAERSEATQ